MTTKKSLTTLEIIFTLILSGAALLEIWSIFNDSFGYEFLAIVIIIPFTLCFLYTLLLNEAFPKEKSKINIWVPVITFILVFAVGDADKMGITGEDFEGIGDIIFFIIMMLPQIINILLATLIAYRTLKKKNQSLHH